MELDPTSGDGERWLRGVFSVQAVNRGTVIRRSASDIDRIVGRDRFIEELHSRGFRAVENAGQIVVFCNREPIRPVT
jgi:hypothetical protein